MTVAGLRLIETPDCATLALRTLFRPFSFSAAMSGLLEGDSPGWVFADHPGAPTMGIASTAEGVYLAGGAERPGSPAAVRGVFKRFMHGEFLVKSACTIYLSVHPSAWVDHLSLIAPSCGKPVPTLRVHYLCTASPADWRTCVPSGYSIQPIDSELLERTDIDDRLTHQFPVELLWGSVDRFLKRAVGYAALLDGEVVSWCTPDCIGGGWIDFACATLPDHRRRHLASSVTAASVEAAFRCGFREAGWMCAEANTASCRTAERVGFVRKATFDEYYYRTSCSGTSPADTS